MRTPIVALIRLGYVLALSLFVPEPANAQQCPSKVVFSNGIVTLEDDAKDSAEELRKRVNLELDQEDRLPTHCFDFAYASSRVDGARAYIQDILESYIQTQLNRVPSAIISSTGRVIADAGQATELALRNFWHRLGGLAGRVPLPRQLQWVETTVGDVAEKVDSFLDESSDVFFGLVEDVFLAVGNLQFITNPDLPLHVGKYRSFLTTSQQLIIVAHSQGNLFANGAFAALTTGADREERVSPSKIKVVSVATPDRFVAGGGNHTTLYGDLILAVRAVVPDQLLANTDVAGSRCDPLPFLEQFPGNNYVECHGFLLSYLKGIHSSQRILNQIVLALDDLPEPTANQAPVAGFTAAVTGQPTLESSPPAPARPTLRATGSVLDITFDASARSFDVDGSIVTWQWRVNGFLDPNSTPSIDVRFGAGPNTTGTWEVSLVVTDDRGATSSPAHMQVVLSNPPPPVASVTISLGAVDDRNINDLDSDLVADTLGPQNDELLRVFGVSGPDAAFRAALEFNVSAIPAGSIVNSATLSLHDRGSTFNPPFTISLHGFIGDGVVSVADGSAITSLNFINSYTNNSNTGNPDYAIDVKSFIQFHVDHNQPFAGILLRSNGEGGLFRGNDLASRDFADSAARPRLVINYSPP